MKQLITEKDIIEQAKKNSKSISIDKNTLITPSALDAAKQYNIEFSFAQDKNIIQPSHLTSSDLSFSMSTVKTYAIGSDHTGFSTKQTIIAFLEKLGFQSVDCGTNSTEACDYPDFAQKVVRELLLKNILFGIVVDATGNPSAITANKFKGIRAANCYNEFTAKSAREHNNANIISLGAKALGEETIKSILTVWIETKFAGGRHSKRLEKITKIEEENFKIL